MDADTADWEYVNEVARHMYEQHPAMAAANPAAKPAWATLDPASKAYWVKDARLAIQATRLAGAPDGSMAGKNEHLWTGSIAVNACDGVR